MCLDKAVLGQRGGGGTNKSPRGLGAMNDAG